jgi:hypothetical protein
LWQGSGTARAAGTKGADVTLIVSYISEEFVALASDRRITEQRMDGTVVRREDTENKAIVLAGSSLMGYTGLAELDGVRMEQWVTETLVRVDPDSYFSVLASEAEAAVSATGLPLKDQGLAFVTVGYFDLQTDPSGGLHPITTAVSNALGDCSYGIWTPSPEFSILRTPPLSPGDFRLDAFGTLPPRGVLDETVDLVKRYRKRHPDRILGVLQLMVDFARRVADRFEGVGKDVSVSVLPRVAIPASEIIVPAASGFPTDPIVALTCMFVPEERDAEKADVYVPATVGPGMATRGGERWSDRRPPGWKD